jgi:hypothetical protein
MSRRFDEYFKDIDFEKPWKEDDWDRFFEAQDRLFRDVHVFVPSAPERPGVDPALGFRRVLRQFGMDPDDPAGAASRTATGTVDPVEHPRLRFWEEGAEYEALPIYCQARNYAHRVIRLTEHRFADALRKTYRSAVHKKFQCLLRDWSFHARQAPRLVAAGHGLGYDADGVRGNMARCRMALAHVDACVGLVSRFPQRQLGPQELRQISRETLLLRQELLTWLGTLRVRFAATADGASPHN